MPTLNWLGRNKVENLKVPFHFLQEKYSVGDSQNKIIHGDNLLALKSLLPRYENKIKCIYIDPPYNTGNEGWIYNDNVNDPQLKKWLGQVVGKEGEDLTRHDKWLCMMYPRLRLLQRLLRDDGAIFISIDDNEQANLKLICDEIFGASNFVAECAVKRSGGRQDSKHFAIINEYLICYAKSAENFVAGKDIKVGENYPKFDEKNGRNYKTQLLRKWGANSRRIDRPNLFYSIPAPDGTELFPMLSENEEGCWRWGKNKMQAALDENLIEFVKKNGAWVAYEKIYQPEGGEGTKKFTTWIDENFSNADSINEIFGEKVFDYPKSVGLIEKILRMCNADKNSIVLDSFAGSGTTAHAVQDLNAADGGSRRFILIEIEDYADNITAERVRRIDGSDFKYFERGERLFDDDGFINDAAPLEKVFEYVYFSETGKDYVPAAEKNLLGVDDDTAYYFFNDSLSWSTFAQIKTRAKNYVIYAEACYLSDAELDEYKITFKQIPFDIYRY